MSLQYWFMFPIAHNSCVLGCSAVTLILPTS
jgi:hypothetical protein